jgi:hypothetical protein
MRNTSRNADWHGVDYKAKGSSGKSKRNEKENHTEKRVGG